MCGITGYFSFNHPLESKVLSRMNNQLVHRGPDSGGLFEKGFMGLAMRRLKVIDLESGDQPMHSRDGKQHIVFNGEVYNYRELKENLRAQGAVFRTHSDTEVILNQYAKDGVDCLKKFNGMFALAIYDEAQGSLFVARDRLGIKPLYYAKTPEGFVFASEIKALLECPWIRKRIHFQAIAHYLSLNYLPSPWTPFEGIYQLEPGHLIEVRDHEVRVKQYWDIPGLQTLDVGEDEAVRSIDALLHRSIERRLIADVPVGAYLSGGVDSSSLVSYMKDHRHEKLKTFAVGFKEPGYDETPYAREVAEHFGTDHYEIHCQPQDVTRLLPQIARHADVLLADQAALPLHLVSELARKHVTVALSGDGGDEVFVGYPTFHADRYHRHYSKLPTWFRRGIIENFVKALPTTTDKVSFDYRAKKFIEAGDYSPEKAHYWWRTVFIEADKKNLFRESLHSEIREWDAYALYEKHFQNSKNQDFVRQCLYADFKVWLSGNNLTKVDSMSMAHSLEARVPFLDHELVEYVMQLPPQLTFHKNQLKYLLKKVMQKRLPESILNRKKAGWHMPIAKWMKTSLKDYLEDFFKDSENPLNQLLIQEKLMTLVRQHAQGSHNHSFKLWGLLILGHWMKAFGPFENLPPVK